MKESYLVIGGGGFLGKRIVEMLLERSEDVSVFDLRESFTDERLTAYHVGDICSREAVMKACKNKTVVIHTASPIHGLPSSVYFKVNVEGTHQVISVCKDCNVSKLVFTSSASVIYNGNDLIAANEEIPYCEVHMDAYNETKAIAEKAVLDANDKSNGGLLTVAIRPSGIFGPRDAQGSLAMAQAAKKGQWRVMIGDNDNLFDMTFVDNAAYAHILAADKLNPNNGTSGEAFNITNDQPLFFWDIPKALFDGLGYKETMMIKIPKSVGFMLGRFVDCVAWLMSPIMTMHPSFTHFRVKIITSNRYFDILKAKKLLNYKPIVQMDEALKKTVDFWYSEDWECEEIEEIENINDEIVKVEVSYSPSHSQCNCELLIADKLIIGTTGSASAFLDAIKQFNTIVATIVILGRNINICSKPNSTQELMIKLPFMIPEDALYSLSKTICDRIQASEVILLDCISASILDANISEHLLKLSTSVVKNGIADINTLPIPSIVTGFSAMAMSMFEARKQNATLYLGIYPSHLDSNISNGETIGSFEKIASSIVSQSDLKDVQEAVKKISKKLQPRKSNMFI